MDIGTKLKELRIKAGLSRDEVAKAIGVTAFSIAHWENGIRKPRVERIQKLAQLYKSSVAAIMGDFTEEDEDSKTDLLDKIIFEFIDEGVLSKNKLFNDLDDTNKQILIGALNKHITKIIKTATKK